MSELPKGMIINAATTTGFNLYLSDQKILMKDFVTLS
jgi:hypothetical protein